ncbi:MAG TPA: hypothetical protein VGD71_28645 [Kribbella sp.]|jgi:hypothetical protein
MADLIQARAICADCRHYLWFDDSLDLRSDEDGWVDEQNRPTCGYRSTIGHVPVPIGADLPEATPADLAASPSAADRSSGVLFS